jgi:hypothetical protein
MPQPPIITPASHACNLLLQLAAGARARRAQSVARPGGGGGVFITCHSSGIRAHTAHKAVGALLWTCREQGKSGSAETNVSVKGAETDVLLKDERGGDKKKRQRQCNKCHALGWVSYPSQWRLTLAPACRHAMPSQKCTALDQPLVCRSPLCRCSTQGHSCQASSTSHTP